MKDFELNDDSVIDLGQASVETKGAEILLADDDGSPRVFAMGIVNE